MRDDHEVNTEDKAKGRAQGSIKTFFQQLPLGEPLELSQHTLGLSTKTCHAQLQASLIDTGGALLLGFTWALLVLTGSDGGA